MASKQQTDFIGKVLGAASQGSVGAVVAALLSSVTEPIVNRVLVRRMTLTEAINDVPFSHMRKFFNTTIATNFIKFPLFEVLNMIILGIPIPPSARGTLTGVFFTTTTLPITNYRYCKSVGTPVDFNALYKAYFPTVGRDIVYGIVRNAVYGMLLQRYPGLNGSGSGRFFLMFSTVIASCLISAPGNEIRGYYLQPKEKRLSFGQFFKPQRFLRSTCIGALIMATSLGTGAMATKPIEQLVSDLRAAVGQNKIVAICIGLMILREIVYWNMQQKMQKQFAEDLGKQIRLSRESETEEPDEQVQS